MLDTFVERWLGPLLIVSGVTALVFGINDIVNLPPDPFAEPHGQFPKRIVLNGPDPLFRIDMLMYGGVAMLSFGVGLVRYFRRERRS